MRDGFAKTNARIDHDPFAGNTAGQGAFDPRDYLKPARAAAKEICKQRFQQFGCAGNGPKIKGITLSKMAEKYAKGELTQVVK